jgi:hypothetical protein
MSPSPSPDSELSLALILTLSLVGIIWLAGAVFSAGSWWYDAVMNSAFATHARKDGFGMILLVLAVVFGALLWPGVVAARTVRRWCGMETCCWVRVRGREKKDEEGGGVELGERSVRG